ncbi:MAG: sensor histidine kinase, partial [Bacteroidota bacterium]|nr:sensor histidine kinase [Bacteroidota bacterium]
YKKLIDSHDSRIIGLIEGEERERKRIASDLHDGLGQILTAAKYCLEGLSEVIPGKYEDDFKICRELLVSAITETRNISYGLMPSSLVNFGLIIALDDLCKHTLLINGHPIRFECKEKEDLKFDAFKEMMIFRIVQEGINNILKHAGATQAAITLKKENDLVLLLVSDNGLGFEMNNLNQSLGLRSIRNRSKLLGGNCSIKSEIGKGTQIRVSFHHKSVTN